MQRLVHLQREGQNLTLAGGFLPVGDVLGNVVFLGNAAHIVLEGLHVGAVKMRHVTQATVLEARAHDVGENEMFIAEFCVEPGQQRLIALDDFLGFFRPGFLSLGKIRTHENFDVGIDKESVDGRIRQHLSGIREPPFLHCGQADVEKLALVDLLVNRVAAVFAFQVATLNIFQFLGCGAAAPVDDQIFVV